MVKIQNKKIKKHLDKLAQLLCTMPKNEVKLKPPSKFLFAKGEEMIYLPAGLGKIFDQVVEELLKEPLTGYASKKFLVESLRNFVFEIFENSDALKDKNEEILERLIGKFFDSISQPFKVWTVLVPIPELKYDFKNLQIGNVKFYLFTESEIGKWKLFRKMRTETTESYSLRYDLIKGYKDKICAEATVKAIDAEKAIEQGKLEVDNVLHVLRNLYGLRGGKAACEIKEPLAAITRNSETGGEKLTSSSDWSWECELKTEDEDGIKQFIDIFDQILKKSKEEQTKLDRRIIRSLRWCGMATQEKDLEDKILKYFTALECLLITKDEQLKGELLAKRISVLSPFEGKQEEISRIIYDPVKDAGLYRIRSDIIHGSEYGVTEEDVKMLDYITRKTIAIISDEASKRGFTKIRQIIRWIET